jgi:hypothetical protein
MDFLVDKSLCLIVILLQVPEEVFTLPLHKKDEMLSIPA